MEPLEKIHHVLSLKRSRLERDVADVQAKIRDIEADILKLSTQKETTRKATFDGRSDSLASDIVALQKWMKNIDLKVEKLLSSKQEKQHELKGLQQTLKEILVKQDIMKMKLDAARQTAFEAFQDNEAETRLEAWVTTNRL